MRLSQNVYMLRIGEAGDTMYPALLSDGERLVLVDTGLPGAAEALRAAIAAEGFDAAKLTHILLSHQDIDHVGCAKLLREGAPGCELLCHELESPYISGERTPIKLAELLALSAPSAGQQQAIRNLTAGFAASATAPTGFLQDGQRLDFCGGITAVLVPGHTPGHLCFFCGSGGVLLSGDALLVERGALCPPVARYTQDMGLALRSLKKLQALPVEQVVSYHGGLWRGENFRAALAAVSG